MRKTEAETIKLNTPPGENPPVGAVYHWITLDASNNPVENYLLPDGTHIMDGDQFIVLALLYGANATGCIWTNNLLAVNHALNTLMPEVQVWVLNSVSEKYETASIPYAVTDADNIQMDFAGCTGLTFNIKIK